ncbi:hypothetical protein [uncultured Algibacter sp.]|uniref:hypothetical protein n=1 Tax=uncultured Algibacter sp. TaxID=298659 RepID=UPI002603A7EB|nr:hypothetical protein [uncultured Algibacter sp.]
MTDTLISLISIFIGIIGGNSFGFLFKKYSLGFIGNTIAGVFGGILFIKVFGRLGFNPQVIMASGSVDVFLFVINTLMSFLGGANAVFLSHKLITRFFK